MIQLDIRDVSPHHLILDSYFSIKVTSNVGSTKWCQFFGYGIHGMLRYYKTNRWCTASIDWFSFLKGVLLSSSHGVFVGDQGTFRPRKFAFNVNFSDTLAKNCQNTAPVNRPRNFETAHSRVGKRRSSAICPPSEIS